MEFNDTSEDTWELSEFYSKTIATDVASPLSFDYMRSFCRKITVTCQDMALHHSRETERCFKLAAISFQLAAASLGKSSPQPVAIVNEETSASQVLLSDFLQMFDSYHSIASSEINDKGNPETENMLQQTMKSLLEMHAGKLRNGYNQQENVSPKLKACNGEPVSDAKIPKLDSSKSGGSSSRSKQS